MGHGMAKNLRQKLPAESPLVVYDINTKAVEAFLAEHSGTKLIAATSPQDVLQQSVRAHVPNFARSLADTP